jgi:hypothetical protein
MVFSSNGQRVYVTGFGSEKIGIFDNRRPRGERDHQDAGRGGRGRAGVALDETRNQLYVMNRIDGTISIVSNAATPATAAQTAVVPLRYDPSPPDARDGRIFLYDARRTSAHGDQACASCHIFGDFDSLAGTSAIRSAPSSRIRTRSRWGRGTIPSAEGADDDAKPPRHGGRGPDALAGRSHGRQQSGGQRIRRGRGLQEVQPGVRTDLLGRPEELDGSAMQALRISS